MSDILRKVQAFMRREVRATAAYELSELDVELQANRYIDAMSNVAFLKTMDDALEWADETPDWQEHI